MKKRIISALIMLIIAIPILVVGGKLFLVFVSILGCIGLGELIKLREIDDYKLPFITKVLSYLSVLYIILNNYSSDLIYLDLDYRLVSVMMFIFMFPIVLIGNDKKYNFLDGLYLMGCVFLIGFSFNLTMLIRNNSLNIFLYLLIITIITDTFALITGKFIGKNKLCPTISPNKTIEGVLGGTIMGTFAAVVYYLTIVNSGVDLFTIITTTICLSLVGQIGDLVFSSIKRHYKVKDFSNLIPGHGGILDRLDSIIFVMFAFIIIISYL